MSPRQIAVQNGDMFYEGKPCKKAGHTMRYMSNCGCVLCQTDRPGSRELVKIARNNGEIKYITFCKPCNKDTEHWTLNSQCVNCKKISDKYAKIKIEYGMTRDEWFWLLKEQYGKCKICEVELQGGVGKRTSLTACVDHDHKTNKVRGLLCSSCNFLIGNARDDVSILNSAIIYLNETVEMGNDL